MLEKLSPSTVVIAEVNEPNSKLLPYLGRGKGHEECDMVYQFASYAMATHAVLRGKSTWYRTLVETSSQFRGCQYVTLLGSHDGMAMKQAAELLPSEELAWLGKTLGGEPRNCLVNYASKPGGVKIVYECCGTPWGIINGQGSMEDDAASTQVVKLARYLAVVGAGLSLRGMPAIYINGLLCADNFLPDDGLDENRTILRQRILPKQLESLTREGAYGNRALKGIMYLFESLKHPDVKEHVASYAPDPVVLAAQQDEVLCVRLDALNVSAATMVLAVNFSEKEQSLQVTQDVLFADSKGKTMTAQELLRLEAEMFEGKRSSEVTVSNSVLSLKLPPYGQLWVKVRL